MRTIFKCWKDKDRKAECRLFLLQFICEMKSVNNFFETKRHTHTKKREKGECTDVRKYTLTHSYNSANSGNINGKQNSTTRFSHRNDDRANVLEQAKQWNRIIFILDSKSSDQKIFLICHFLICLIAFYGWRFIDFDMMKKTLFISVRVIFWYQKRRFYFSLLMNCFSGICVDSISNGI